MVRMGSGVQIPETAPEIVFYVGQKPFFLFMANNRGLPGEYLPVSGLTYEEAGFFHPKNWEGETIGYRVRKERVKPFFPVYMDFSDFPNGPLNAGALVKAGVQARQARMRAHENPKRYARLAEYGPGQEFRPADHRVNGNILVFDQSTLITRGPQFHLKPEDFPEQPPFTLPEAQAGPLHVESSRFHYVREYAGAAAIRRKGEVQLAHAGSMDYYPPGKEYPYPVGPVLMPEVITIGEPAHYMAPGGQQILFNVHAAFVMPGAAGRKQ